MAPVQTPPVQSIVAGQQRTNLELGASQVIDMGSRVFSYDPPGSPIMRIVTERAQSVPAKNTTVRWMEDAPVPVWFKVNADVTDVATTIVTTESSAGIIVGDLLKVVQTGEVVRVTAINNGTNTLTVTRAFGGTAAAISATTYLLNIRGGQPEGDTSVDSRATVKLERTNYTEIFKTSVEVSRTITEVDHYFGNVRDYERRKAGEAHALSIERTLLFGAKKEDLSGARPIRSAGGLDEFITTNRFACGGTMSENDLIDFTATCFRYAVNPGRNRKLLICSREISAAISSFGLNKLRINDQATKAYGMAVTSYITPHGTLDIIQHRLMENGYSGMGMVIDPDGIFYRPLHNTQLRTNIHAPDQDGFKDEYLTEASHQFVMEQAHGIITGVTNLGNWTDPTNPTA